MTVMTAHVQACVAEIMTKLRENRTTGKPTPTEMRRGYRAMCALLNQPWDDLDPELEEWVEGYETALVDVCDAIAVEWGIELPAFQREVATCAP